MKNLILKMLLLIVGFAPTASAYFETDPKLFREMNGIKVDDYPDFMHKWKLVTVRYREDTKEMRFTYANEKAWKGLMSLNAEYEDGAIFGKVGAASEADPDFISSRVPSGAKRYQFMVRNKKKYKDTDGWGYALFNEKGNLFADDPKVTTQACAACHRLVPERNFVFSRSVFFNSVSGGAQKKSSAIVFKEKKVSELTLPADLQKKGVTVVESLEGDLQKSSFSGTLDEVVPLLVDHAKVSERDSILYVSAKNFSLVQLVSGQTCDSTQQRMLRTIVFANGRKARDAQHCQ
jgi:hypothetical protein